MRSRFALSAAALAAVLAAAAPAGASAAKPLRGPDGTSRDKVLVIGTDGTRWDLLREAMAAGRAPNLKALARRGFGRSTLLPYTPPVAFTMSAVGWSTISSGVGPEKHGVHTITNTDPEQATKHGYLDFLTRLEHVRSRLSTFMVGDWGNLGLHFQGGPIFSDAIDVKYDTDAGATAAEYDREDARDTRLATRYLRHGNPDAGFVYLGVVDETAHNFGSATADYRSAIDRTDARIGRLLRAIKARPTYGQEHWTVIVATDHGQKNLDTGSLLSHGMGSKLERTSFVIAAGPGVRHATRGAGVVDINPTVLHQVGISARARWRLDGRSFVKAGLPPDVTAALRGGARHLRLRVIARRGALGGARIRTLRVRLPQGVTTGRSPTTRTVDVGSRRRGNDRVGLRLSLATTAAGRRAIRHAGGLRVRATVRPAQGPTTTLRLLAPR